MTQPLSPQEYEDYILRHERWNFVVNLLDLTFYNLGMSFIFGATVLSLYASHLTASAALIGLIPAVQQVAHYLPQLITARRAETLACKKPFILRISVLERVPYLFVALAALFWPEAPEWVMYCLLLFSLGLASGAGGLAAPAWQNMLAKVIRPERRGFFFGLSNATGGLMGIAGAAISRHFLATYTYPTSYGLCFLLAFGAQVCSWLALSATREPARDPQKAMPSAKEYLHRLPKLLRDDRNFSHYLMSRTLIILGTMAASFYIVYARRTYGVDDSFAGTLTMVALLSQSLFTPVLGLLGDRRGHKWASEICTLAGAAAALVALLSSSPLWLYGVFILLNASTAGTMVTSTSMMMSFAEPDDLPTYIGLANTLLALPTMLAPIIGGWIADLVGFRVLFALALLFSLLGLAALRRYVRDPMAISERALSETPADPASDESANSQVRSVPGADP